jgi:hypothetical protein
VRKRNKSIDCVGLRLPRPVLRVLRERGIFAQTAVSVEHQHLAKRYVVRGLESGGAVGDLGHYVTFARENGQPTEYLHPVESIGVNGLHSVVVGPSVVRIEMLRKARTYELLITQHRPQSRSDGNRPSLETKTLFRGIHGRLELDLSGKDKNRAGSVLPTFYSLSGEDFGIPRRFRNAVRAITKAVNCLGCSHCHYVRAPQGESEGGVQTCQAVAHPERGTTSDAGDTA